MKRFQETSNTKKQPPPRFKKQVLYSDLFLKIVASVLAECKVRVGLTCAEDQSAHTDINTVPNFS